MNKTVYFLRKMNMRYIEERLEEEFNLELCFRNGKEMILKNNEVLVCCKRKYASILMYVEKEEIVHKIGKIVTGV